MIKESELFDTIQTSQPTPLPSSGIQNDQLGQEVSLPIPQIVQGSSNMDAIPLPPSETVQIEPKTVVMSSEERIEIAAACEIISQEWKEQDRYE